MDLIPGGGVCIIQGLCIIPTFRYFQSHLCCIILRLFRSRQSLRSIKGQEFYLGPIKKASNNPRVTGTSGLEDKTVLTFFLVLEKWGGETHFRKLEMEKKSLNRQDFPTSSQVVMNVQSDSVSSRHLVACEKCSAYDLKESS